MPSKAAARGFGCPTSAVLVRLAESLSEKVTQIDTLADSSCEYENMKTDKTMTTSFLWRSEILSSEAFRTTIDIFDQRTGNRERILGEWERVFCRAAGAAREYCQWEVFNASCPRGEVLVMDSAQYGRMELGRCLIR